jgi:hypothetical protein
MSVHCTLYRGAPLITDVVLCCEWLGKLTFIFQLNLHIHYGNVIFLSPTAADRRLLNRTNSGTFNCLEGTLASWPFGLEPKIECSLYNCK